MSADAEIERLLKVRRALRALGFAHRRLLELKHPLAAILTEQRLERSNTELKRELAELRKRTGMTQPELEQIDRAKREARWAEYWRAEAAKARV